MAKDPGMGYRITATVVEAEGHCNAGLQVGDTFEVSIHNPAAMCGVFYHQIFPTLSVLQFGGKMPWWPGDAVTVHCSDPMNTVTVKLERSAR